MAKGFAEIRCSEMTMDSGCGVIADESRMAKGFTDTVTRNRLILLEKEK